MQSSAEIQVLLATYNGERFLPEQIDSILAQDYPHLRILARDDGSRDRTHAILDEYRQRIPASSTEPAAMVDAPPRLHLRWASGVSKLDHFERTHAESQRNLRRHELSFSLTRHRMTNSGERTGMVARLSYRCLCRCLHWFCFLPVQRGRIRWGT